MAHNRDRLCVPGSRLPPSAPAIHQGVACIIPTVGRNMLRRLSRRFAKARAMGRRGNPYDNAKAESFMKTLKVEAVYRMAYNLRGRYSRPSPLHRRGLQHPQTPLRARLSERIRGSRKVSVARSWLAIRLGLPPRTRSTICVVRARSTPSRAVGFCVGWPTQAARKKPRQ
jgi:hypothetical protein